MRSPPLIATLLLGAVLPLPLAAQVPAAGTAGVIANAGPYNVAILAGGIGVERPLDKAGDAVEKSTQ